MTAPTPSSSSSSSTAPGPGAAPELAKLRIRIGLMEVVRDGKVLRRLTNFAWESAVDPTSEASLESMGREMFAAIQAATVIAPNAPKPELPDPATITEPARVFLRSIHELDRAQPDHDGMLVHGAGQASVVRSLENRGIIVVLSGDRLRAFIATEAREWVEQAIASWEGGGSK